MHIFQVFVLATLAVASAQFMPQRASPNRFFRGNQGGGMVGGGVSGGMVGGGGFGRGGIQSQGVNNWERFLPEPINYGPKVYGPGALNRYAIQPSPFEMRRALSLVQNNPNAFIVSEIILSA